MSEPVVPRPAATVMLLRDRSDLEVLLLHRSSSAPFVPGAHVFPGGAVEAADAADHDDLVVGLDAGAADAMLDVDTGGRSYWIAAVRECLEEVGVLLATDHHGRPIDADHPLLAELDRIRRDVEGGQRTLADVYRAHDLRLPLGAMAYVSRWITPELSPRRYDARFFVAAMPPGQRSLADGWEAIHVEWWHPTDALAAWQAGNIELIEPTVASLRLLQRFDTTAEALAALSEGAKRAHRVPEPTGGIRVPLPNEPAPLDRERGAS